MKRCALGFCEVLTTTPHWCSYLIAANDIGILQTDLNITDIWDIKP